MACPYTARMDPPRHIGRRHIHLEVTDSTNSRVAELAHDPAYAGTVVTADLQVQGRGQHGRVWHSPPGANVLLSALLFPPPRLRRPAVLTAWAAVAVSETVLQVTRQHSTIKWPNDVLLGGKKVCGILIECGVAPAPGKSPARDPYFVVGIGLNVNQTAEDFRRTDLAGATSLSMAVGRPLGVKEMTQLLIQNLDAEYDGLLAGGLAELEARWAQRLGLTGRVATAELMDATEVRGRLTGLGFDRVQLQTSDGTVRQLRPEEVRHLR
ncbi:MAG TPA: biotin--[acetyl-CoA-carboxylase] ligase [Gemmataceae bacterium]|nr:biotin--[acetyl-CoA-carboxylase] ligase [Gemmataceae bacterium]